jgi:hypothetical protein
MKKLAKLFLFYFLLSISVKAANYYQATAPLKIRTGGGKNFTAIGHIKKGEKVLIDTIILGWGRVIIDGKIKGYSSMKYLTSNFKDDSKVNQNGEQNNENSNIWIWLIIGGIAFYIFINSGGKSQSNSSSDPPKLIWWYCRDCHTLVKTPSRPSGLNCRVNHSHRWYDLGELGTKTFICRDCGIQVRTNRRPSGIYCNVNGSHRWDEI